MNSKAALAQKTEKKALLVIDVQENLLDSTSKLHMEPASIDSFVVNLNKSILFFKENGQPVIYTQNLWTNPILNMLTGNVCKKGAKGTGIDGRVIRANGPVYEKSKMSVLSNKEFVRFLKENSISELYITGLFAEACVQGTAKDAIRKSYKVTIIEDAIGSKTAKKKMRSVGSCVSKGAKTIKADQLGKLVAVVGSAGSR
jgi:nicotinamidase-related amidase